MCLSFVCSLRPEQEKGFAYKVVRPYQDFFTGKWPKFHKGGAGTTEQGRGTVPNLVKWKIGRLYRVKHNRIVQAFQEKGKYPAGVHLYKRTDKCYKTAKWHSEVVLVCWYTSGMVQDNETIVAMRCTPVAVIRNRDELLEFDRLRLRYGPRKAVEKFNKIHN